MEKVGKADVSTEFYSREEEISDLRRGPWTVEEDFTLINYIAIHGEGRWNSLARSAGLRRTGKSCRLRWLNYLRPDVRRGNITVEEQLLILELHSQWGNRWSKIAQHLPGRTDNEIKNYWRTRVQKHAKQLKCDVNSKQFKETMRYLWMPRLVERIQAVAGSSGNPSPAALYSSFSAATTTTSYQVMNSNNMCDLEDQKIVMPAHPAAGVRSCTPENASSDSFGTPVSDLTECYDNCPINQDYYPAANQATASSDCYQWSLSGLAGYFDQRTLDFIEQNSQWTDGGDVWEGFWNVDDTWFFQPQWNGLV